jgi:transposase
VPCRSSYGPSENAQLKTRPTTEVESDRLSHGPWNARVWGTRPPGNINMYNKDGHLGIDTGKDELHCAFMRPSDADAPCWRMGYTNNALGFKAILERTPAGAIIAIEPTGTYSLEFVKYARSQGRQVLMAPPLKAKNYLRSIQSRAKTDKLDCVGLAMFARDGKLRPYPVKSPIVEQVDQLLSARRGISASITNLKLQMNQLQHAQQYLEPSIVELKKQLRAIDKQISTVCKQDKEMAYRKSLLKVPGIGPVTATAVLSRLVSKDFETPAQFVAYCGLDIGVAQSGKRKGQLGLTKQGDSELRRLLYVAAQSSVNTKDSPFKQQYHNLKASGRKHKEAINIIARKIAKLCWSMVKYQSQYDPERVFNRPMSNKDISETITTEM